MFWSQKINKLCWCIRGRCGVEIGSVSDLYSTPGSQVSVNSRTFASSRSSSGMDFTNFAPVGNAAFISFEDHFGLTASSVMTLPKYTPRGGSLVADAL